MLSFYLLLHYIIIKWIILWSIFKLPFFTTYCELRPDSRVLDSCVDTSRQSYTRAISIGGKNPHSSLFSGADYCYKTVAALTIRDDGYASTPCNCWRFLLYYDQTSFVCLSRNQKHRALNFVNSGMGDTIFKSIQLFNRCLFHVYIVFF